MLAEFRQGDCRELAASLGEHSVDALITDPPYHLASIVKRFGAPGAAAPKYGADGAFQRAAKGFLGKAWDGGDVAFQADTWRAFLRVMKPGAHLAAFGAPRNAHRLACAIEDAGFELRDTVMWLFGKGMPKSHNVGRAVDAKLRGLASSPKGMRQAAMGAAYAPTDGAGKPDYAALGKRFARGGRPKDDAPHDYDNPWRGFGTALKPAYEPIIIARAPLSEDSVAANYLRWGVGGFNIDAARVPLADGEDGIEEWSEETRAENQPWASVAATGKRGKQSGHPAKTNTRGRWPAHVAHDGGAEVMERMPDTGPSSAVKREYDYSDRKRTRVLYGGKFHAENTYDDPGGSAARFFYCAKAGRAEREAGCAAAGLPITASSVAGQYRNDHPTVKPLALMRWILRLIAPPGGLVLDPFCGSGTTACAAVLEDMRALGFDTEAGYLDIARARASAAEESPREFTAPPEDPAARNADLFGEDGQA